MVNTCEPAQRPSRRIKLKWLTSLSQKARRRVGGFNGAGEFIRRFLLHVLPDGFVRIRTMGCWPNRHRAGNLARCRELLVGVAAADAAAEAPVRAYQEMT